MSRFALTGARIFDGDAMHDDKALVIDGRRVVAVTASPRGLPEKRLDGGILAPGFIDAQVNGGGGALFNADPSPETLRRIAEAHRKFGTTGLLPTVITDRPDITRAAAAALQASRIPGILGIHIEGPFIDRRRAGAHDPALIRAIARADIDWLKSLAGPVLLTLAPSTVDPGIIRELSDSGIIVSLGHAEATAAETIAAIAHGARGFTHLYNAMSPFTHRAPGMVGAGLADRDTWCGIIADGHHVDPLALKVAIAAKPRGKIFLVSDAMPAAAGGPDTFELQGRAVHRTGSRLELPGGTLAGSCLTMDAAVRYCVSHLETPIAEALRMASLYPAQFLRLDRDRGRLAPGYLADLVHLTDVLTVAATWIGGEPA